MAHIIHDEISRVLSLTSELYGIPERDLCNRNRSHEVSEMRYIIFMYLHYEAGLSSNEIGKYFGRSRFDILRGIRTLKGWMQYHAETKEKYNKYVEIIKGGD